MNKTTITVDKDIRDDLMIFKVQSQAKNINEVLELAIMLLNEYYRKVLGK